MIRSNAVSVRGKSHVQSDTVCQDAYCILTLRGGQGLAVVADGVGSAKCANIGAEIAVRTVADFIADNYPIDNSHISIKSMIRTAYNRALIELQKEAIRNHNSMSDYDTTLMAVIYDGKQGYYAHVGDGGVVGLKSDGTYTELTKLQNIKGRVIPLRAGYEFWQIDEIKEPLASILIATDGMMDRFRNDSLEQGFYIPLLMIFADPYCIQYLERKNANVVKIVSQGQSAYNRTLIKALYHTLSRRYHFNKEDCRRIVGDIARNGTPFELIRSIQDDKTFVCLYNTLPSLKARNIQYYTEPDWNKVSSDLKKRLYSSLYEDN